MMLAMERYQTLGQLFTIEANEPQFSLANELLRGGPRKSDRCLSPDSPDGLQV